MAATPGNSENITAAGVVTFDGTSVFTGSTVTQHGVVVGAASNGVQTISVGSTGTVLTGVTSNNPTFSSAPAVTSITLNGGTALGTYLQTSYTPVLGGSGSNPTVTYSLQIGSYTQIGNIVIVDWNITITAISGGSGNVTITLPIANGSTVECHGTLTVDNVTFSGYVSTSVAISASVMQIVSTTSTGTTTPILVSTIGATASLRGTMIYQTT